MVVPADGQDEERTTIHQGPTSPSFLAMTEKMKSVCGADEKKSFCSLAQANPERPPDPKERKDWMI